MNISTSIDNNVLVVAPQIDNLDANNSQEFKTQVDTIIKESGGKKIILNLKELNFIDSSGLGSLISILKSLSKDKGNIKIACLSKTVRSIFELVRLHKLFDIFSDVEQAKISYK